MDEYYEELTSNIKTKLTLTLDNHVVRSMNYNIENTIAIYKIAINQFYIFRVQKRSLNYAVNKYLTDNSNSSVFTHIEYNPNAINY
jgi:hypothetical protein